MLREVPVQSIINVFEEETKPIFVVYGVVPYFEKVISDFRVYFQGSKENLYLTLDMEIAKRDTEVETFCEIIQQLGYWYWFVEKINAPNETNRFNRLHETLQILQNIKEQIKAPPPDDKLLEFGRFANTLFFPTLKDIHDTNHSIILEFNRFEKVAEWSAGIFNHILKRLLETMPEIVLRFVIFDKSALKPHLFYGSNEEDAAKYITFYKFPEAKLSKGTFEFGKYDVFLAYNDEDRQQVEAISLELKQRGLNPWLGKWKLPPDTSFQEEIERVIYLFKAIVVFVGQNGIEPWQDIEIRMLISHAVQRKMLVIPVLLSDAESLISTPLFLKDFSWVEFTKGIDKQTETLDSLALAIKSGHNGLK